MSAEEDYPAGGSGSAGAPPGAGWSRGPWPDRGAGGEPQLQWTLTEQPFGFFFWVESGGRLLVQDVVPTASKVASINIDTFQVDYRQIKMDSQTSPLTDAKSVR